MRLLAVAKFSPHHGVDRLIRGLAEYKGARPVLLTLVGVGAENPSLEKLVSELKLEDLLYLRVLRPEASLTLSLMTRMLLSVLLDCIESGFPSVQR